MSKMKARETNFTVEKKRARWEDTAGCTWKERMKCAEFCSSLPLLFRHDEQDRFSIFLIYGDNITSLALSPAFRNPSFNVKSCGH